jgi:F-type H+-transporting ATPase subunit delta
MVLLEKVVEGFRRVANARMGIAEVRVSSAARLSPAEEEALRAAFRKLTRQQVELEFQLDDSLLGGVRAQIDSTVYDGTVRGQLERIREELTAR